MHYPVLYPGNRNPYSGKAAIGNDRLVYKYNKGDKKSKFIALITHTGASTGKYVLCTEITAPHSAR